MGWREASVKAWNIPRAQTLAAVIILEGIIIKNAGAGANFNTMRSKGHTGPCASVHVGKYFDLTAFSQRNYDSHCATHVFPKQDSDLRRSSRLFKKGQIKSLNIPLLWRFMPPSQRLHFLLIVFKGMFS